MPTLVEEIMIFDNDDDLPPLIHGSEDDEDHVPQDGDAPLVFANNNPDMDAQHALVHNLAAQDLATNHAPLFANPHAHHQNVGAGLFDNIQHINFEGFPANLNHWLLHHHQTAALGNGANNHLPPADNQDDNNGLDIANLAAFPPLHGALAEELLSLFYTGPQHAASLRAVKRRFQLIRERKPSYWQRVAFGMFKRTLRGPGGGCDACFIVKKNSDSENSVPPRLWGHKFILASNPIFRQLFGYRRQEDALDEKSDGQVTEIDLPSISSAGMRLIIMAAYDLRIAKLHFDDAVYLQYWAPRFCLDSLTKQCQDVINRSPKR